ncbi:MAG TPA: hypothetical protein VGD43_20920 [Micromonospora sp.]
MTRLIEIEPATQELPPELTVAVGDILRFAASGGRVREGSAVEPLGILVGSVVGTDGTVVAPQGPPNVVLFRACSPGRAQVDVVTGDPFRSPTTRDVTVVVESTPPSGPMPL